MSRSYKKNAVVKDGGHPDKKAFSQKFRSINKIRVALGLEVKLPREVENQYNIRDWIYREYDKTSKWFKKMKILLAYINNISYIWIMKKKDYFKDVEKYDLELYCHECGSEEIAYDRTCSNCEVWHCKVCKLEIQTSHKPNEDNY